MFHPPRIVGPAISASLFLCAVAAHAGSVPEQEPNDNCNQAQPFGCGQVLAPAFLQPGEEDWFGFFANQGEGIVIVTDELDPGDNTNTVLELFADDCNTLLAADDDGGNGNYSLIDNFVAPYTGFYNVKVFGPGPADSGPYAMVVDCFPGNPGLSRQEAQDIVLNDVIANSPFADSLVAYFYDPDGPDSTLAPGTAVADWDSAWVEIIPSETYFFWLNDEPNNEFTHHTTYCFVDKQSGFVAQFEGEGWPIIDGVTTNRFLEDDNPERFYGNYINNDVSYDFTPRNNNPSQDWALVVVGRNGGINSSGTKFDNGEKKARVNDINRIKEILNKADRGPRLPEGNITVVSGAGTLGATRAEFCTALDNIDDDCDKIWIFYIGHGAKKNSKHDAGFILRGANNAPDVLSYKKFAQKLLAKGIPEYCIVVEDCHSGLSIDDLKNAGQNNQEGLVTLKGVVITSSDAGLTKRINCDGAPFIEALRACFADPGGDLDKSGKTKLVEALVWLRTSDPLALSDNPLGYLLDERLKVRVFNPYSSKKVKVKVSGKRLPHSIETTCYQTISEGNPPVKTLRCRTRVYLCRKSQVTKSKNKPLKYECFRNGIWENLGTIQHLVPRGQKSDRKCFLNLPINCAKLRITNTADASQTQTIDIQLPTKRGTLVYDRPAPGVEPEESSVMNRTTIFTPGEGILHTRTFVGTPGEEYTSVLLDPIPGWDLSLDPGSFEISTFLDTTFIEVRGTVPEDAVEGGIFTSVLIHDATGDSLSSFDMRSLVETAAAGDLTDGSSLRFQALNLTGQVAPSNGTVSLDNSLVTLQADGSCFVPVGAELEMNDSSVYPDSGVSFSFAIEGAVDWKHSTIYGSSNGLVLNGATGLLDAGGSLGSLGDGLTVSGDLTGLETSWFVVDSSAVNGVVFDGASGFLQTLIVENSGSDDVVLNNSSTVALLDSYFDDLEVSVEAGSELTRTWSTWVAPTDVTDSTVVGAVVEIRDAFGALVGSSVVDTSGFTEPFELREWVDDGSSRTFFTPHEVTISFADWDSTFSYTADETRVIDAHFPGVAADTPGPPALADLRLRFDGPVPARSTRSLRVELALPESGQVEAELWDVQGRRISTLLDAPMKSGVHPLEFDLRGVSSGVYFLRLRAGARALGRRLVVMD